MSSTVIQEFLVALGVKVDDQSIRRFDDAITKTTKTVVALAAAAEAMAITVVAGVAKVASNFEALYFSSQRTKSAVTEMKAFGAAARNFGATAEEAQGSIEGLARALRVNPGNESYLKMLGIETRDANGDLKQTEQLLVDLSRSDRFKKYAQEQMFTLESIAQKIGISENTLLAMAKPGFADEVERLARIYEKMDLDKVAAQAHDFEVQLQDLTIRIQSVLIPLGNSLMNAFGSQMEQAAEWFDKNGDKITKAVVAIGDAIVPVSQALANLASIVIKIFEGIYKVGHWIGDFINKALPQSWKDGIGQGIDWLLKKLDISKEFDALMGLGAGSPNDTDSETAKERAALPRGIRNNNPGNLEYAGQRGATKELGPGGRFAVFRTREEGLAALARQIELYAARGYNSVLQIMNAFAPPGENDTELYAERVAKSMRVGSIDELDLNNSRTVASLMNAIIAHENMNKNPYPYFMVQSAAEKAINNQVTIAPNVNMTITGSSDPVTTGRAAASEVGRLNQDLARGALAHLN